MIDFEDVLAQGLDRAANTLGGSKAGTIARPTTDDELHALVWDIFNVNIPRKQICKNHKAPFTAFADAYFARYPVTVWKASRGFGGKSLLLALLGLTEAVVLGAKTNILGGSGEQSQRVLNYINGEEMPDSFWNAPNAPIHLVVGGIESDTPDNAKGITKKHIKLTNGGYLKTLMASSRSVRGPHPQRLRLDEIDEMDIEILDAALGQPMTRFGIEEQTVCSSTHHYSNGTMTEIIKRGEENGWGYYEWCYKENLVSNGGWLENAAIKRKQNTVTKVMWKTEYEGQEPSPTDRAIDVIKCEMAFDTKLGEFEGNEYEYVQAEKPAKGGAPEPSCHRCHHPYRRNDDDSEFCSHCNIPRRTTLPARYSTGTDWAKERDWTVIHTVRVDVSPARLVAWERTGRLDWPSMIARHEARIREYGGAAGHDKTGIGGVIDDYLTVASEGVLMVGMPRHEMLSQYITAIESGRIKFPMIKWMFNQHRLASVADVYSSGKKNHLPDSMAAGAIAWKVGGMGMVGEIWVPNIGQDGKVHVTSSARMTREEIT